MEPRGRPVLTADGLEKSFGATHALRSISLVLRAGEIHALLGENGAGKSTFVKILVGAVTPDSGQLILYDEPLRLRSVRDAISAGIVPIYQELSLMGDLSIAENLAAFDLAAGTAWSAIPRRQGYAATSVLEHVGLALDVATPVSELSLAERQLVEIARAVARDCAVFVLDEPTASLSPPEVRRLFAVLQHLRNNGRTILFISHRLDEVLELADHVSVLRDGRLVMADAAVAELETSQLVEAMIGRTLSAERVELPAPRDEVRLEARDLALPPAFAEISFKVHASEIVGIVGLVGSGAEELGAVMGGALAARDGEVLVDGRTVPMGRRVAAVHLGIGYLPPDRKTDGIFPTVSVRVNASATVLPQLSSIGWINPSRERAAVVGWLHALRIRPEDPEVPIAVLSGGNQQKVLVARMFAPSRTKVIVAIEPTRGVDIGARREIHQALVDSARRGLAVLTVSSDLDEILAISHRVLVVRSGRIVGDLAGTVGNTRVLAVLNGAV